MGRMGYTARDVVQTIHRDLSVLRAVSVATSMLGPHGLGQGGDEMSRISRTDAVVRHRQAR